MESMFGEFMLPWWSGRRLGDNEIFLVIFINVIKRYFGNSEFHPDFNFCFILSFQSKRELFFDSWSVIRYRLGRERDLGLRKGIVCLSISVFI